MDKNFIYGKLNSEVTPVLYKGLNTNTAQVVVNNSDKTIKVNVIGGISSGGDGKINSISVNNEPQHIDEHKNVNIVVPTKTSEIENDSDFINTTVDNLLHYYLRDDTYSQREVDDKLDELKELIRQLTVEGVQFEIIESLPAAGRPNVIYLLKSIMTDSYSQ